MSTGSLGAVIAEFAAMGGHGLYVWLCYGAAVAVVLYNLLSVRRRERRWVRDFRDRDRRHAAAELAARLPADPRGGVVEP